MFRRLINYICLISLIKCHIIFVITEDIFVTIEKNFVISQNIFVWTVQNIISDRLKYSFKPFEI